MCSFACRWRLRLPAANKSLFLQQTRVFSITDSRGLCRQLLGVIHHRLNCFLYFFCTLSYSTIYPTPRTPSSLTWVSQSRLAFFHHRRVGWPSSHRPSGITILQCAASLAAGGYVLLRQTRVSSIVTNPLSLIVRP